jgi:hypothetical protein
MRIPAVPPEGVALASDVQTVAQLLSSGWEIGLEPGFVARRWSEEALGVAMPVQPTTPAQAKAMRERLVLMVVTTWVRPGAPLVQGSSPENAYVPKRFLSSIVSDCTIGRSEACNIRFQDVLSVSRSHCSLVLSDEDSQGGPKVVVYDEGSLTGTQLRGRPLGVGRSQAEILNKGDTLKLGSDVTMSFPTISSVMRLDDHHALADFFEMVGDRHTANTISQEPRLTEMIVSESLSSRNMNPFGAFGAFDDYVDSGSGSEDRHRRSMSFDHLDDVFHRPQ